MDAFWGELAFVGRVAGVQLFRINMYNPFIGLCRYVLQPRDQRFEIQLDGILLLTEILRIILLFYDNCTK